MLGVQLHPPQTHPTSHPCSIPAPAQHCCHPFTLPPPPCPAQGSFPSLPLSFLCPWGVPVPWGTAQGTLWLSPAEALPCHAPVPVGAGSKLHLDQKPLRWTLGTPMSHPSPTGQDTELFCRAHPSLSPSPGAHKGPVSLSLRKTQTEIIFFFWVIPDPNCLKNSEFGVFTVSTKGCSGKQVTVFILPCSVPRALLSLLSGAISSQGTAIHAKGLWKYSLLIS